MTLNLEFGCVVIFTQRDIVGQSENYLVGEPLGERISGDAVV